MATATDTILFEMDGRTAKLAQAVEDARARLKSLEGSANTASAAGDAMGNRYAVAARKVASAGEAIARTGELSAASTKQLLQEGSAMATMFGPEGAVVGAVGFAILAIVGLFDRASEEAKKAREKTEAQFAELQKKARGFIATGDVAGLGGAISQAADQKNIDEQELLRLQRRLVTARQAAAQALTSPGYQQQNLDAAKALVTQLETETDAAAAKLFDSQRNLETLRASLKETIDRANDAARITREGIQREESDEARRQSGMEIADMTKKLADLVRQDREKQQQELAAFAKQYARTLVDATATLTDDIQEHFDELIEAARKLGKETEAVNLEHLRDSAVQTQRFLEGVASDLKKIEESGAAGADLYEQLKGVEARILGELSDTSLSESDRKRLNDELLEIYEKQRQALHGVGEAVHGITDLTDEAIRRAQRHTAAILEAVDAALQLASAFGAVDSADQAALENIAQTIRSARQLSEALKGVTNPETRETTYDAGAIAGGAFAVVGTVISGLSRMRDEQQATAEAVHAVTVSLERMADSLLRSSLRLNDFEAAVAESAAQQKQTFDQIIDQWESVSHFQIDRSGGPTGALNQLTGLQSSGGFFAGPETQAAIDALRALAEASQAAAARLKERAVQAGEDLDKDLEVRRALLAGDTDLAERLRERNRLEAEYAAAVQSGLYTEDQLAALKAEEAAELQKFIEDQQKAADEKAAADAAALAQSEDDARTRIAIATAANAREAEAIRRHAQQQQELANITDPALKALVEFAQAAEEAAIAANELAAAHRAMEDLDVRLLRAQGKDAEADEKEFQNRQQREYEDAQKRGETQEYLDTLKKTQDAEREKFDRDRQSRDASVGGGGVAATSAASPSSSTTSFAARATVEQADRLIGLSQSQLSVQREIRDAIRYAAGLGALATPALPSTVSVSGGLNIGSVTFSVAVHTTDLGNDPAGVARELGDLLYRQFTQRLARENQRQLRSTGADGVVS